MHHRPLTFVIILLLLALAACRAPEQVTQPLEDPTKAAVIVIPVTPTPIPAPTSTTIVENYTVRNGDTLGAIAARYDLSIEELMKLNGLSNPNALQIGQVLQVTLQVLRAAPADFLLPNSEAVYSPAYLSFAVAAFVNQANGYLATYREKVEGDMLSGSQIIQLVAERFSVGPRVLLALLEYQGGWVTGTSLTQDQLSYPMGLQDPSRSTLFYQTSWVANRLNEGYYGKLTGQLPAYRFKDRTRARLAPNVNAGTAAIQNVLALTANWDAWQDQIGPNGFIATYRSLFGDPNAVAIEPLLPPDLKQPPLRLPWNDGATWFYTGGPHSAWGDLAAWSAIDVTPSDMSGSGSCNASRDWALAAAPGRVVRAERGRVMLSLSNNNFQGSGWALLYMHIASAGRAAVGLQLNAGDRIGHPSCEGGDADATHLHLARLYNGQWIDANTVPFILSGWQVTESSQQYEGKMVRGAESREALNGRDTSKNAIVADGTR